MEMFGPSHHVTSQHCTSVLHLSIAHYVAPNYIASRIVCHTVIFYFALYAVQKIETEFLSRKIAQHDPPNGSSWFAISAEFDELLYNTGSYQMQLLLMLLHYEHVLLLSTYIISTAGALVVITV